MIKILNALRKRAGVRKLLSEVNSNPKVSKNGKLGVLTAVLHLAPGNMSGHEVCPKRSPGCTAACLHFAGSPAYLSGKTKARITRTKLLFADRNLFMNILVLEILQHLKLAKKMEMEPAIRLNATSDIVWEKKKFILFPAVAALMSHSDSQNIISLFPTIQFYDYTAIPGRIPPENYHLTFSAKENNAADVSLEAGRGTNIAVVFGGKLPVQITLSGRKLVVINGDEHDYRPADPERVVVGLKAKGTRAVRGGRDRPVVRNGVARLRGRALQPVALPGARAMTANDCPHRVQLRRSKGWRMPENTVKVDRSPSLMKDAADALDW